MVGLQKTGSGSKSSFSRSMGVNSQEQRGEMFAPALFKVHGKTGFLASCGSVGAENW
jgi:hypothetical protein